MPKKVETMRNQYTYNKTLPVILRVSEDPPTNGTARHNAPTNVDTNGTITQDQLDAARTEARREERAKLNAQLEQANREARENAERVTQFERQQEEARLATLEPLQRMEERIRLQDQTIERERNARVELERNNANQIRALGLTAYRERVLREYGDRIFPAMVVGNSEEELESSAESAHQAFEDMEKRMADRVLENLVAQGLLVPTGTVQPVQQQTQPVQQPLRAQLPPNPALVSREYGQPNSANPQAGLPTATNPLPVSDGPGPIDIGELTSEDAVRSGRYGGELRSSILRQIKGTAGGSVNLGSSPRYVRQPQQYMEVPGGVQQPLGHPTGPVQNPQMQQQPQVQQQPVQTSNAAQAAVEAVRAGTSQVSSGFSVMQKDAAGNLVEVAISSDQLRSITSASDNYARQHGVTKQAAYAQRFAATPPVNNQ